MIHVWVSVSLRLSLKYTNIKFLNLYKYQKLLPLEKKEKKKKRLHILYRLSIEDLIFKQKKPSIGYKYIILW